ncbi:MAG: hypothetical protein KatS3mg056_2355 [Chloroflexus sp.]|jgi:hypothetical protein|nr:MAG: hypothetical protein KatS3mg056_2355 [Chloroflexus sp.]
MLCVLRVSVVYHQGMGLPQEHGLVSLPQRYRCNILCVLRVSVVKYRHTVYKT